VNAALVLVMAAGLALAAAAFAIAAAFRGRGRARLADRLGPEGPAERSPEPSEAWWQRLVEGGRGMERWFQDDVGADLLLVRAGWREAHMRTFYYLALVGLPLAAALVSFLALERAFSLTTLLLGLMAVIIGLLLPRWILRSMARSRQLRIREEVPLFINLMVLLLEAGLSTRQALHSLVRDGSGVLPVLGGEFRLALRQMDAGGDLGVVLSSMGSVLDVPELSGVLGVLRQVERYGGEVREPLLSALAVLEERQELLIQERVNALAGYMTWVMVLFFFPFMFVCVAGPAAASIFRALAIAMP
jgi:tight adherence protein C